MTMQHFSHAVLKQHLPFYVGKEKAPSLKGAERLAFDYEDDAFLMANLRQKTTGLPMVIWVSEKQASHGARIKVSTNHSDKINLDETVSVSIANPPEIVAGYGLSNKDLQLVSAFIKLNEKLLVDYWNSEIDTGDLITDLIKLSG